MTNVLRNLRYLHEPAFVHRNWVKGTKKKTFPIFNPTNGRVLSDVPDLVEDDINEAIEDADEAFQSWRRSSCYARSQLLKDLSKNMMENRKEIATIMTLESGKPIQEALGEVNYAASFLEWFGEEAKRINGEILPNGDSTSRRHVLKQPVGVCGMITPWNFPLAMITRKVGGAIAAGCTSVVKPSEETPLTAIMFGQLLEDINAPQGLVNIITCSRENTEMAGKLLCDHEKINKISFTGSTAVGKWLLKRCAGTVKRVSMELGGNAPFIVFNSANAKLAAENAVKCRFRNAGQTCICAERFFVQDEIYDEFMREFKEAVSRLKIGDPLDNDTTLNCVINANAAKRVQEHIDDAVEKGANIVHGGQLTESGTLIFEPTILENCNTNMRCFKEETFGPVASVTRFTSESDVIKLANDVPSGLAGYFFSDDYRQILRVSEALDVGMVGVNEAAISNEIIPFGGVKESGIGREGSVHGINEYLELKYVCIGNYQ